MISHATKQRPSKYIPCIKISLAILSLIIHLLLYACLKVECPNLAFVTLRLCTIPSGGRWGSTTPPPDMAVPSSAVIEVIQGR